MRGRGLLQVSDEGVEHFGDFAGFFDHFGGSAEGLDVEFSADFAVDHELSAEFATGAFAVTEET